MPKHNMVHLEGNVGQDSKVFGGKVTKFSLAIFKKKDIPPIWIDVTYFGDHNIAKGTRLVVDGRLDINEYQGNKKLVVIADSIASKDDEGEFI